MKKKNTRDYGKPRASFNTGGFIDEDYFGHPTIKHVNWRGGVSDGPDPASALGKSMEASSGGSEDTTFRMATKEEAAASFGLSVPGKKGGGGGGGGKAPRVNVNQGQGGGGGGGGRRGGGDPAPASGSPDPRSVLDREEELMPRAGTEDI